MDGTVTKRAIIRIKGFTKYEIRRGTAVRGHVVSHLGAFQAVDTDGNIVRDGQNEWFTRLTDAVQAVGSL